MLSCAILFTMKTKIGTGVALLLIFTLLETEPGTQIQEITTNLILTLFIPKTTRPTTAPRTIIKNLTPITTTMTTKTAMAKTERPMTTVTLVKTGKTTTTVTLVKTERTTTTATLVRMEKLTIATTLLTTKIPMTTKIQMRTKFQMNCPHPKVLPQEMEMATSLTSTCGWSLPVWA